MVTDGAFVNGLSHAGSILQVEPKHFDSGCKPEPVISVNGV